MIHRIVKMTFKKEEVENFLTIFNTKKALILGSKGCKHLELLQDTTDLNVFFTYSIWETATDLENYRESELFKTTWSATKVLFSDKPQAWSLSAISNAIEI